MWSQKPLKKRGKRNIPKIVSAKQILNMEKLKQLFGPALIHSLHTIVYFLFIVPFDAFVNAVERLAKQRESKALKLSEIKTPWPFFSFMKRVFLDFGVDFLTLLAYILAPLLALVALIWGIATKTNFFLILGTMIGVVVACYYAPLFFAWLRDCIVMMILPFKKFLSWCYKPAQYFDLNVTKDKPQTLSISLPGGEDANPKLQAQPPVVEPPVAPAPVAPAPAPVAPAPVAEAPSYYVYVNGQQQGPFTSTQIVEKIAAKTIDKNAHVWKEGMAEWMPINKVNDLKNLIK